MAHIDTIQLSGTNFKNVLAENITGLLICNTDTEEITFDLILGPSSLDGGTSTTGAVFILKDIPVPQGSTFVWEDDDVLSDAFKSGNTISKHDGSSTFVVTSDLVFLARVGSGHTASVILKRK